MSAGGIPCWRLQGGPPSRHMLLVSRIQILVGFNLRAPLGFQGSKHSLVHGSLLLTLKFRQCPSHTLISHNDFFFTGLWLFFSPEFLRTHMTIFSPSGSSKIICLFYGPLSSFHLQNPFCHLMHHIHRFQKVVHQHF